MANRAGQKHSIQTPLLQHTGLFNCKLLKFLLLKTLFLQMIMDNLDDTYGMQKLLQEIGSHHFFYDAYEPHFEVCTQHNWK
jgi:hypothetical protein